MPKKKATPHSYVNTRMEPKHIKQLEALRRIGAKETGSKPSRGATIRLALHHYYNKKTGKL